MRSKMSPLYVMAVADVVLGLFILLLSVLFKMDLSDFAHGFCIGVAGVLTLGGVVFLVWHFTRKKSITI